jgi:hypothetical protein
MKSWIWVIIALVGIAVMLAAYAWREHPDSNAPWASGVIIISPEAPADKSALMAAIPARLRLLASSDVAEMSLFLVGDLAADKALGVKGQVRAKLIELPLATAGIGAPELQTGRLPEAGKHEVVAGAKIEPSESLRVGGESLKVVGVLKPELAIFATAYLVPPDAANNKLFPEAVPTVLHSWVMHASADDLRKPEFRKRLDDAFPPGKSGWVTVEERLDSRSYYLYLAGLAIFLFGGSGALIALFRWLAGKVKSPVLAAPLLEMKARPRLVWGVHVIYFGLVIFGSWLIAGVPEMQTVLMSKVREALATRTNPLGVAGEAYLSGNVPLAAVVTFLINFVLGSLAMITLPSSILPGCGALLATIRAFAWGLILAPLSRAIALAMLPHSLTMLLEGEGYILATIFSILIPIYIVRRRLGRNVFTRFGHALMLGLKSQFWIALVLAIAAIYEATEVILINR